jgi:hypothetical protein
MKESINVPGQYNEKRPYLKYDIGIGNGIGTISGKRHPKKGIDRQTRTKNLVVLESCDQEKCKRQQGWHYEVRSDRKHEIRASICSASTKGRQNLKYNTGVDE